MDYLDYYSSTWNTLTVVDPTTGASLRFDNSELCRSFPDWQNRDNYLRGRLSRDQGGREMTDDRFVVRAERSENRKVTTVWLAFHPGDGGAYQWSIHFEGAYPFNSEAAALKAAKECPGPWFNMPDMETVKIFRAKYTPPRPASLEILR